MTSPLRTHPHTPSRPHKYSRTREHVYVRNFCNDFAIRFYLHFRWHFAQPKTTQKQTTQKSPKIREEQGTPGSRIVGHTNGSEVKATPPFGRPSWEREKIHLLLKSLSLQWGFQMSYRFVCFYWRACVALSMFQSVSL